MKLKSMMKRLVNLLAAFILSVNCISAQNLTRWVNPFIGTGAVQSSLSGNNYPGATVPFGMVQLVPTLVKLLIVRKLQDMIIMILLFMVSVIRV